jgi:ribosomal protein S18 acetylase RimI-like enzyme
MRPGDQAIRLVCVVGTDGLAHARHLFRSYADEFAASIAETLCFQGFEAEVAGLPGRYAPPSGCLIIAMEGETPAGCVALRDLGDGTCEMKRLYVAPSHRGRGVGKLLVERIVRRGEQKGYRRMVLDTLPEMTGALTLYRQRGFVETAPIGTTRPSGPSSWRGRWATRARQSEEDCRMGNEPLAEIVQVARKATGGWKSP